MARKRHHIVSRGYQRSFADGERIQLCDKYPTEGRRRIREVGTRDAFVRDHFNSHPGPDGLIDPLEDEWQRIEGTCLPALRSWADGHEQPLSRDAARVIAALHFARSYGYEAMAGRVHAEFADTGYGDLIRDPALHRRFKRRYGRLPQPGELEAVAGQVLGGLGVGSAWYTHRMGEHFNWMVEKLRTLRIQAIRPAGTRHDFIFGDCPFVWCTRNRMRVGARGHLAIGDAALMFLPLGPRLAVFFTARDEGDHTVEPWRVQTINWLTWRAAMSQIAAAPSTDLERALATRL